MRIPLIAVIAVSALLAGCESKPLEAPASPPFVQAVPQNWPAYQKLRSDSKAAYIKQQQVAYDWFADFAFSESDGVPFILLKLLPRIAPELWGSEDNFLDVVGLFVDQRQSGYPIARGIGISAFARTEPQGNIDYASFTCGACHIGRVRLADDRIKYIDGGVNTEFNIVQYRVRVHKTIQKIYGQETNADERLELAVEAFLEALDETHANDDTYFYNNYQYGQLQLDAAYERQQIDLFRKNARATITRFVQQAENDYTGYGALLDKNYQGFQSRSLEGFPGMADATGISAANGYISLKKGFFSGLFASFALPGVPGITDFMSVWEQAKREAEWDSDHQTLVNGGGQWNGNIPIPIYRNLAAQLTLGLEDNDIRASAFAVDLLSGLPATVYPFDVNIDLASQGQTLFENNCAQCHQPHNGKVYSDLGTNLDRSYVVNWLIRRAAISGFSKVCSPATTVDMAGKEKQPCAVYDGVSLEGKKSLIMSPNAQHHGYNARPLSGVWAQAPYLHNGSVPTLYHLLVPGERPDAFIKSRLDYDQKLVGYAWQSAGPQGADNAAAYTFDTNSFTAFSNRGHDKNVIEGNHTYKLDWSDDKAGAMALLEYMKTL